MFKENEYSIFGKTVIVVIVALTACSALFNIYRGVVPSPYYFSISILGLVLFLIAKFPVISKGDRLSLGTAKMSGNMANIYRFGYWLIITGILCTFFG